MVEYHGRASNEERIPQECLETEEARKNQATAAALFDRHFPQYFTAFPPSDRVF